MRPEDYDAFCEVIVGLAEIKGRTLSSAAIELYWRAMKHWPLDAFKQAAEYLLRSCQWMPEPHHFEALRRAGQLTAAEAWKVVLSGEPLDTNSRAFRVANFFGGQTGIRRANLKDLPFILQRFFAAYDELADVEATRTALPQIAKSPRVAQALTNALPSMSTQPQLPAVKSEGAS